MKNITLAFILLISTITITSCPWLDPTLSDWVINPANNHSYAISGSIDWPTAKAFAEKKKGYLVVINNSEENSWLLSQFGNTKNSEGYNAYHIGITDEAENGNFKWINGDPLTFNNWAAGSPTNYPGDYAQIMGYDSALPAGTWHNINNTEPYPAIIEKD